MVKEKIPYQKAWQVAQFRAVLDSPQVSPGLGSQLPGNEDTGSAQGLVGASAGRTYRVRDPGEKAHRLKEAAVNVHKRGLCKLLVSRGKAQQWSMPDNVKGADF